MEIIFSAPIIIFILFSFSYGAFFAVAWYHIAKYAMPGDKLPKLVLKVAGVILFVCWLIALYFFIKAPTYDIRNIFLQN